MTFMKGKIVVFLFCLVVLAMAVPHFVLGEVASRPQFERASEEAFSNGKISGEGTFFEITDSEYLNVTLTSVEPIKVFLESVPEIIGLSIEAGNGVGVTELTLTGLEPNKSYYKYQDSYKNEAVFVSNELGNYTWEQDIAVPHHIWLQEVPVVEAPRMLSRSLSFASVESEEPALPVTVFFPEQCAEYGAWDEATLTCVLNQDINYDVEITDNNVTLNCDNHKISGNFAFGINLNGRNGIGIKNCEVHGKYAGIKIYSSTEILIEDCVVSSPSDAVYGLYSSGIILKNNSFDGGGGINFYRTSGNTFLGNNITGDSDGVDFFYSENSIIKDNKIIGYNNGFYFYGASGNTFSNNSVVGNFYIGVNFYKSDNNVIENNIFADGLACGASLNNSHGNTFINNIINNIGNIGFDAYFSNNNTIVDNTFKNNSEFGFSLYKANNNTVRGNSIEENGYDGFDIYESNFNIISENNVSNNGIGLDIYDSNNNNKIYHNNFENNTIQAYNWGEIKVFLGEESLLEGNYWSDYTGPGPYIFENGQDSYPFIKKDGWKIPAEPAKTPVLIVPGIMGTEIKNGDDLLWADTVKMVADFVDSFMDPLAFDNNLVPSDSNVLFSDVIKSKSLSGITLFDYTGSLIDEFGNQGYVEGETLFTFPYDWRYGVSGKFADDTTNVDLLKAKIDEILQETGSENVNVVAHSNGGLLVKKYVADNPEGHKIDKAIFVGVPNTGAPKAVKALLQGDDFGISFGPFGLNEAEMKKISQNMPVAYDLLPSQTYYNIKGSFISLVDIGFGLGISEPEENALDYTEFEDYLADKGLNQTAFVNSKNLRTIDFDNFDFAFTIVAITSLCPAYGGTSLS